MAQAAGNRITRRTIVAAGALTSLTSQAAIAQVIERATHGGPVEPDATLLALGRVADDLDAIYDARCELSELEPLEDEQLLAIDERRDELRGMIVALPARTIDGLKVKARLLNGFREDIDEEYATGQLTMSLMKDVLAL